MTSCKHDVKISDVNNDIMLILRRHPFLPYLSNLPRISARMVRSSITLETFPHTSNRANRLFSLVICRPRLNFCTTYTNWHCNLKIGQFPSYTQHSCMIADLLRVHTHSSTIYTYLVSFPDLASSITHDTKSDPRWSRLRD